MKKWRNLGLIFALITLAGCANKAVQKPKTVTSSRIPPPIFRPMPTIPNIPKGSEVSTGITDEISGSMGEAQLGDIPNQRIVYFDYDMSVIKQASYTVLEEHAAYLDNHPDIYVRLEGHADERGSREYNLALGEKRAEAVKDSLMTLGIFYNRLNTLSYGEEQPIARGHSEKSWWQNRRVELIF